MLEMLLSMPMIQSCCFPWGFILCTYGWAGSGARYANDEKTAVVCLELMFSVTIRNRDRINKLWPLVHDHLKSVIIPSENRPISKILVEAAVLGLLRVCQRILVYKPEVADLLLTSLQFVRNLDSELIREMADKVATEVLALVKGASSFIHQVGVTTELQTTCLHAA